MSDSDDEGMGGYYSASETVPTIMKEHTILEKAREASSRCRVRRLLKITSHASKKHSLENAGKRGMEAIAEVGAFAALRSLQLAHNAGEDNVWAETAELARSILMKASYSKGGLTKLALAMQAADHVDASSPSLTSIIFPDMAPAGSSLPAAQPPAVIIAPSPSVSSSAASSHPPSSSTCMPTAALRWPTATSGRPPSPLSEAPQAAALATSTNGDITASASESEGGTRLDDQSGSVSTVLEQPGASSDSVGSSSAGERRRPVSAPLGTSSRSRGETSRLPGRALNPSSGAFEAQGGTRRQPLSLCKGRDCNATPETDTASSTVSSLVSSRKSSSTPCPDDATDHATDVSDELTATLATAGLGVPMGAASLVATDTWPDTAMPPLQLERRSGNLMRRKSRVACKVMQSKSGQEYLCD